MNTPQFDLSAMLSTPQQTAVQQIPCDKLHPYHNHKFELYSGERLEDMVASIKENGVLSPIIVQPDGDGYEILIGHNRWNASRRSLLKPIEKLLIVSFRAITRLSLCSIRSRFAVNLSIFFHAWSIFCCRSGIFSSRIA